MNFHISFDIYKYLSVMSESLKKTVVYSIMDQYSIIISLCLLSILYFIYWLKNVLLFRKILNKFPGRDCNFLLGDVASLSRQKDKLFLQFREYAREFTSGYRMYGGLFGSVNFIIPEDVEVILSSSKHIDKNRIYNFLHPWLGTGLLTSTDSKWVQRRKILTPAFHFNILRRFIKIFGEHNERLVEEIQTECSKSKTNIVPLLSLHTLNIICETSMGISLHTHHKNVKEYWEAIHGVGDLVIERSICPWLYYDCIYYFTSSGRKMIKYLKTLHQFSTEVIKNREKMFNENDLDNLDNNDDEDIGIYVKRRFAMLDILLLAKKRNAEIDDAGIREEVDTFMFEGHDTTAMGLSFTLFMLANHKHIQEKVREEIDRIFKNSTRTADYKDLQSMHYLEMCIKESLRLYPSVPFISRKMFEEVSFRDGQYKIPAECDVNIHIYDLHRNPKVFPNPGKYDPDRFLPENAKNRHPYAYIPFSAGPRNCIGQKFAMLELKSVISSIVRYFIIEPIDTSANLVMNVDLILRPKDDIHVKFRQRIDKI